MECEDRVLGSRAGDVVGESLKSLLCYFRAKEGVWSLLPLCPKTHCGVCVTLWCRSLRFWGLRKGKRTKPT